MTRALVLQSAQRAIYQRARLSLAQLDIVAHELALALDVYRAGLEAEHRQARAAVLRRALLAGALLGLIVGFYLRLIAGLIQ